ncbi:MAG: AbrB/MazE/SpoVT family DNA-binding domain-containing protein [Burkholderiaceae bacterium]|jgi:bifunctional DNA-binding transcriptional regulator/antitoxin component of YhaV-PrlF toxin-antitoxin module|nr:AbrB/MazE/SpoVT family DNA-binding domain-containing protein [Burkholderiaceae bacterium]
MVEMTLTAKGQFTFNKALLEHLGVKAGEKIAIRKQPDGSLKINASKKHRNIMDLMGSLEGKTDVKLTDAELSQAIADSYATHGLRGAK